MFWNRVEDFMNNASTKIGQWYTNIVNPYNREDFEYNKNLQQQIFDREDNAVQRRVADLEAAGLSPVLAANGQGAGAGTPIKLDHQNANPLDAVSFFMNTKNAMAGISRTKAETDHLKLQDEIDKYNLGLAKTLGVSTGAINSGWTTYANAGINLLGDMLDRIAGYNIPSSSRKSSYSSWFYRPQTKGIPTKKVDAWSPEQNPTSIPKIEDMLGNRFTAKAKGDRLAHIMKMNETPNSIPVVQAYLSGVKDVLTGNSTGKMAETFYKGNPSDNRDGNFTPHDMMGEFPTYASYQHACKLAGVKPKSSSEWSSARRHYGMNTSLSSRW